MAEYDQEALKKGFQGLGENIDKLYARPSQKVCFRVCMVYCSMIALQGVL